MPKSTREKLVSRAEYLVRRRGYNGFSFSDLSEDVGIRKASINYYFPHKTDLLLEMMVAYRERFVRSLGKFDEKHNTARERFKAYVAMNRQALGGGHSMCLYVSLGLAVEGLSAEVREELKVFYAQSMDWLQTVHDLGRTDRTLPSHGDPEQWANQVISSLQGAQVSARVNSRLEIFDLVSKCLMTTAT
ncbi:MAG: TetR/AcrR family transcriptional regulator [Planctomycetota bacterium]